MAWKTFRRDPNRGPGAASTPRLTIHQDHTRLNRAALQHLNLTGGDFIDLQYDPASNRVVVAKRSPVLTGGIRLPHGRNRDGSISFGTRGLAQDLGLAKTTAYILEPQGDIWRPKA